MNGPWGGACGCGCGSPAGLGGMREAVEYPTLGLGAFRVVWCAWTGWPAESGSCARASLRDRSPNGERLGVAGRWIARKVWASARCGQECPHHLGSDGFAGIIGGRKRNQFHRNWATLLAHARCEWGRMAVNDREDGNRSEVNWFWHESHGAEGGWLGTASPTRAGHAQADCVSTRMSTHVRG